MRQWSGQQTKDISQTVHARAPTKGHPQKIPQVLTSVQLEMTDAMT